MTNGSAPELVVIAIEIDDPTLLDRLTALLSDIPGLRLALVGESVDAVLVASRTLASRAEVEQAVANADAAQPAWAATRPPRC